ncbi:MAG: hypothetical protein ACWGQW_26275 [bacterium]
MSTSKASWKTDHLNVEEFNRDGFTIVKDVVPQELLESWVDSLRTYNGYIHNDAIGSMGERGNYLVADGPTSFSRLVGLEAVYGYCQKIVSNIVGRDVISSPYPLSIVNVKIYEEDGCQGAHYDSQPITCLLFVTEGAPLEIQYLNGSWHKIAPVPGAIAIFQGRQMLHRVPPGSPDQYRVTIPMNYYFEDDTYRPEGLDDAIYGNKDFEDATG